MAMQFYLSNIVPTCSGAAAPKRGQIMVIGQDSRGTSPDVSVKRLVFGGTCYLTRSMGRIEGPKKLVVIRRQTH